MKHTPKVLLAMAFCAGIIACAEKPKTVKSTDLTAEEMLLVENLSLKKSLLEQQQNELVQRICGRAGIPVPACSINLAEKKVVEAKSAEAAKK